MERSIGIHHCGRVLWSLAMAGALLAMLWVPASAATRGGHASMAGWAALQSRRLSSVVWSPDGRNIAFVVTSQSSGKAGDEFPKEASIWLLPVAPKTGTPTLLYRIPRGKYGPDVPVGLFWLTARKLGWAVAPASSDAFALYVTNLEKPRPRRLTDTTYNMSQTRTRGDTTSAVGPDDIYYNSQARHPHLIFVCQSSDGGYTTVACIYHTDTQVLDIFPMPAVNGEATISARGSDQFLAVRGASAEYSLLWHSNPVLSFMRFDKPIVKVRGELYFPRPSPDGRFLLWLQKLRGNQLRMGHDLILYSMTTKSKQVVARVPEEWNDVSPALGCPFSWSPKGDRIAYADGSLIRIVRVPHFGGGGGKSRQKQSASHAGKRH